MFWSIAHAQSAPPAQPGILELLFPFAIMMVIFYMFYGRPQQKRLGEHKKFLENMKRGDKVITASGIYGEVTGINEKFVTLEIADNVRIKILRSQILGAVNEGTTT
jgi:preprotein translocase subunit YajC